MDLTRYLVVRKAVDTPPLVLRAIQVPFPLVPGMPRGYHYDMTKKKAPGETGAFVVDPSHVEPARGWWFVLCTGFMTHPIM
jgi:hypothetical protein